MKEKLILIYILLSNNVYSMINPKVAFELAK